MTFEGTAATSSNATFLYADVRGSIAYRSNAAGTNANKNTYDPYGQPGTANAGRFQYTGQAWLDEVGLYHYKARFYSPILGRFLQVDPIGYEDQVNLYAYVANDPVNGVDPTGMCTGSRINSAAGSICGGGGNYGSSSGTSGFAPGLGKRELDGGGMRANATPSDSNNSQGTSGRTPEGGLFAETTNPTSESPLSGLGDALDSAGQALDVSAAEILRSILIAEGVLFKKGPAYTIYTLTPESQAFAKFYGLAFVIGQMPELVPTRSPGSLGGRRLNIAPGYTVMLRNSRTRLPTIEFISGKRRQEFKFKQPDVW